MTSEVLERGRQAIREQAWERAFAHLSEADQQEPLAPEDLQQWADAAHLSGRGAECGGLLARAHQGFLSAGQANQAVLCAVRLCFELLYSGDFAQAGGWLARAHRMLDSEPDCVEHGHLLMPEGLQKFHQGDAPGAFETFNRAAAIADRFGDRDLATMALHAQGRALIRMGELADGVKLLDEAMAAVMAGDVSLINAGVVYCSVIESCSETLDLRRAHEWTTALTQWCASQPEANPFRGACLLHRAEVLQYRGDWPDALEQARLACERLSHPTQNRALGAAFYRTAELHRLRGEFKQAEEAYRNASQWGTAIQPGLALLRFAQGQLEIAHAAIRGAANEIREPVGRAIVLAASVEIMLESGDTAAARTSATELAEISESHGAALLKAIAASRIGAVLLAEGEAQSALPCLRKAWTTFCELEVPLEAARARMLLGVACRSQGDHDTSAMEFAGARLVFERLGAVTELARLEALSRDVPVSLSGPLSPREVEVMRQIASGATNREIAATLGISEKTVARHISNIFVKLDLPSRAAATAYAFRNNLI